MGSGYSNTILVWLNTFEWSIVGWKFQLECVQNELFTRIRCFGSGIGIYAIIWVTRDVKNEEVGNCVRLPYKFPVKFKIQLIFRRSNKIPKRKTNEVRREQLNQCALCTVFVERRYLRIVASAFSLALHILSFCANCSSSSVLKSNCKTKIPLKSCALMNREYSGTTHVFMKIWLIQHWALQFPVDILPQCVDDIQCYRFRYHPASILPHNAHVRRNLFANVVYVDICRRICPRVNGLVSILLDFNHRLKLE